MQLRAGRSYERSYGYGGGRVRLWPRTIVLVGAGKQMAANPPGQHVGQQGPGQGQQMLRALTEGLNEGWQRGVTQQQQQQQRPAQQSAKARRRQAKAALSQVLPHVNWDSPMSSPASSPARRTAAVGGGGGGWGGTPQPPNPGGVADGTGSATPRGDGGWAQLFAVEVSPPASSLAWFRLTLLSMPRAYSQLEVPC